MTIYVRPTAKGQITLNKKMIAHLGLQPGDRLELNALPGQRLRLSRVSARVPMSDLIGLLPPRNGPPVTDGQIEDGIIKGAVENYRDGETEESGTTDKAA